MRPWVHQALPDRGGEFSPQAAAAWVRAEVIRSFRDLWRNQHPVLGVAERTGKGSPLLGSMRSESLDQVADRL